MILTLCVSVRLDCKIIDVQRKVSRQINISRFDGICVWQTGTDCDFHIPICICIWRHVRLLRDYRYVCTLTLNDKSVQRVYITEPQIELTDIQVTPFHTLYDPCFPTSNRCLSFGSLEIEDSVFHSLHCLYRIHFHFTGIYQSQRKRVHWL